MTRQNSGLLDTEIIEARDGSKADNGNRFKLQYVLNLSEIACKRPSGGLLHTAREPSALGQESHGRIGSAAAKGVRLIDRLNQLQGWVG